jgi:hypothetical protein
MPKGVYVRTPGLSRSGDAHTCMVVGCTKKALYRSRTQTQRGYCADHKALAATQRAMANREAFMDNRLTFEAANFDGPSDYWLLAVDDTES